ncbi:cell division cycle-associated protein 4 [Orycteropus afer afer]|uniref:Cell division cycle-associated protein 4 n=1 Tax=Orycteropus afer afer TaxID=1230840 RepID=A0A8B7A5V5_ORYAF|nr:cell division cycle-associated protein 4 [Orycteropus afer afer]
MLARGLKRKCWDSEEELAVRSYALQRQSLLDMSLVKLQLCHMLVEPNLCRSVLIANTVRQIQGEMTQDGAGRLAVPQDTGPAPLNCLVTTDILCHSAQDQGPRPDGGCFSKGSTDALARSLSSDPPSITAAQVPGHPPDSFWDLDSSRESRGSLQRSLDQIFETLESKSPGCVEEFLSDVDSPHCDLDTVLTDMVGSARAGPCDTLESLVPLAAPPPSPSCKADLGELDHIVEILVET